MNSRRTFFSTCAAFVAGCAIGIGTLSKPKRWTTNPEFEKAHYEIAFVFRDKFSKQSIKTHHPVIRTNNPNYLTDGKGLIPEFIYA